MTEEPILEVQDLVKRFGGITATDHLSLTVGKGRTHAVIGPNGAGKTTLIGQLTGEIKPDSGRILFEGNDIVGVPAHKRPHLGVARSFQITSIFPSFSVIDNVSLAVQAHQGHSFRFWRNAAIDPLLTMPAMDRLVQVGLDHRAETLAANLAHGEKRQLEIAMALATRPRLLLLDEPMAGMGTTESARIVSLLKRLRGSVSILLIEHDMDTIWALADDVTVLVYGRAIASGPPSEIRNDKAVQEAYLGGEGAL
ncbi:ABC transporter ATP-binding protein [Fodinicurvata sp. EGI_FJ10296]|uniref:ABC transporter ATP-binding protein n=1 Tax=Fodinicurvata sp. EGI_FJ10296 TaxID=3231908 RepID=UPI0034555FDF